MTFQEYGALDPEERWSMYDLRLEAIDTFSGSVLVSQILDGGRLRAGGLIPGTHSAYELVVGEDLLPVARIFDYSIVTR
jgi:hypothetical protein